MLFFHKGHQFKRKKKDLKEELNSVILLREIGFSHYTWPKIHCYDGKLLNIESDNEA